MTVTLHHLDNSRSHRVLWLLEELGLDYEIRSYRRDSRTMLAPPELRQVHPLGKAPVLTDGDVTVAESGAIVEYLVETYGPQLKPADATARRRWTYWLHFAEGSMMSPLLLKLIARRMRAAPWLVRPLARRIADRVEQGFAQPNIERQLAFIESELAQRPWFAGDEFSAADIQMSFPLELAQARVGLDGRPAIAAFLERIHARPAYRRAVDKGGALSLR